MNRQGAKRCATCGKPLPAATKVTPSPSQPPAPIQMPVPPQSIAAVPPPRAGVSVFAVALLACLFISLCGGLSGVALFEKNIPMPTVVVFVTAQPTATFTPPPPPPTVTAIALTPTPTANPPYPVVTMKITQDGRFGFATLQGDPNNPNDDNKPLTFRQEHTNDPANGETNNTRIWIDGKTPLYGDNREGRFIQAPVLTDNGSKMSAVWQTGNIVITESVQVVLSTSTHRFDTFQITYVAENRDTISHTVGMRLMIDTLIGNNDGVPFNVPGRGMITAPLDLRGADIPNFVQVYENQDLSNPGVIVQMTLTGGGATTPDRFVLGPWCMPNNRDSAWDFVEQVGGFALKDFHQCGKPNGKLDSAVGIYFDGKPLAPSESRQWTTFYGLGGVQRETVTSALSLVKPPDRVQVGEEFWISALVQNPQAGQKVKLTLPAQLQLTQNAEEQAVPTGATLTQVSWRVRAVSIGNNLVIGVALSPGSDKASAQINVFAPPTPTPTVAVSPTPCATTVLNPTCP